MASGGTVARTEGVASILDTDLYKLTMQCVIHSQYRDVHTTYRFTNRTPHMRLTKEALTWLQAQIDGLASVTLTDDEYQFLSTKCKYLNHDNYLDFLRSFRFKPSEHVKLEFTPTDDGEHGDLNIDIEGLWVDTILYEIPILALVSEAYFKFCDRDWSHDGQEENAFAKGAKLLEEGCIFSEFGTRRRRDYKTQDLVLQGLTDAGNKSSNQAGKLGGTSNVHFAHKYGLSPVGTVAHEWFMGIAAATDDYENATETALEHWIHCFGRGVLAIALTDTFGTPTFLRAFSKPIPKDKMESREMWMDVASPTYAGEFAGVRQDSGDPKQFIKTMREYYDKEGIREPKSMVFSDALNVERCLEYKRLAEEAGFKPTFGIGTFLTNDFKHADGGKSEPLNIVIKLSSANGRPAVKLSDDMGKNTGDKATVQHVKEALGYVDRHWEGANESSRWSGKSG
jgi:nicotinate phosphoribosyltransferase